MLNSTNLDNVKNNQNDSSSLFWNEKQAGLSFCYGPMSHLNDILFNRRQIGHINLNQDNMFVNVATSDALIDVFRKKRHLFTRGPISESDIVKNIPSHIRNNVVINLPSAKFFEAAFVSTQSTQLESTQLECNNNSEQITEDTRIYNFDLELKDINELLTEYKHVDHNIVNNNMDYKTRQTLEYPKIGNIADNGFKIILDLNQVSDCPTNEEYEQEQKELERCNIAEFKEFNKEQLEIRLRLAKRITKDIYNDAVNYSKDIADCYVTHPPYMFYTNQEAIDNNNTTPIRRLYGICKTTDNEYRAHAVSAMSVLNNKVIGGISLEEMIPIDNWSKKQLSFLNSGLVSGAGAFNDPLGFIAFIE